MFLIRYFWPDLRDDFRGISVGILASASHLAHIAHSPVRSLVLIILALDFAILLLLLDALLAGHIFTTAVQLPLLVYVFVSALIDLILLAIV